MKVKTLFAKDSHNGNDQAVDRANKSVKPK